MALTISLFAVSALVVGILGQLLTPWVPWADQTPERQKEMTLRCTSVHVHRLQFTATVVMYIFIPIGVVISRKYARNKGQC